MRSLSLIIISITPSACAGLSNKAPNSLNPGGTGKGGHSGRGGRGKPSESSAPQNQGGQGGASFMREMMMSLKSNKLEIE